MEQGLQKLNADQHLAVCTQYIAEYCSSGISTISHNLASSRILSGIGSNEKSRNRKSRESASPVLQIRTGSRRNHQLLCQSFLRSPR